jgi:hypothetical protein
MAIKSTKRKGKIRRVKVSTVKTYTSFEDAFNSFGNVGNDKEDKRYMPYNNAKPARSVLNTSGFDSRKKRYLYGREM